MAGKRRRRISDRTKLAATLLDRGDIPYNDAKLMTASQIISLYHFDHNMFHESGHPDRDKYWNLKPRLIREHREKTKRDAAIIAKGRRIRRDWAKLEALQRIETEKIVARVFNSDAPLDMYSKNYKNKPKRKIRSRGFDKTRRRKMSGKVVER
jgi:hypothetical protein